MVCSSSTPSQYHCPNFAFLEEKTRACEDLQETQQQLDNAQLQLNTQEHNGELIPRPHRTPGDRQRGFILIDAINLRDRPLQYRSIRVCQTSDLFLLISHLLPAHGQECHAARQLRLHQVLEGSSKPHNRASVHRSEY
jgi:hypothetical protein